MVEPKCPNMYGEWSCTRVNCLVSWDIQTRPLTDGFWLPGLIATRAHELDARQSGARTLYFERSTPCSVICRWIFRSEARLVTIPSINSVRQHDWLRSMNNIQVYHTKYKLGTLLRLPGMHYKSFRWWFRCLPTRPDLRWVAYTAYRVVVDGIG